MSGTSFTAEGVGALYCDAQPARAAAEQISGGGTSEA